MASYQYRKMILMALSAILLATGCQSKYQPIETGAAQTGGGSPQQAAGKNEGSQQGGVVPVSSKGGSAGPLGTAVGTGTGTGPLAGAGTETGAGTEAGTGPLAGAETEAGTGTGTGTGPLAGVGTEAAAGAGTETTAAETTAAAPVFSAADETVYVTGDDVNVRASCSTSSDVVATLKKGASVKRTGYSEEWSRVIYQEQERYIASRYLSAEAPETQAAVQPAAAEGEVRLNSGWQYAEFSKINSGAAMLYRAEGENRKGITVCVNAGHGTSGGSSVKTLCHPDGTQKVTGGSTAAGATTATAVSAGMTFADGTPEPKVTLALALKLKAKLLAAGYDVLMIRESDDVQLDNIARTVIANNAASCHIALHWDSTTNNKGAFYMSVPNNSSYRNMEPVKSHWQQHHALGESLIGGLRGAGVKIFSNGAMEMDLTQTSYSTVPSVDIELGDKASDHSDGTLETLAAGLLAGVNAYFGQ